MVNLEIQSNAKIRLKEILKAVDNLDMPDLKDFFEKIAALVIQRKSVASFDREAKILEKINENEYERLSEIIQQVEGKGVGRLKYLVELSKVKNKTVADLMTELNIENITPADV